MTDIEQWHTWREIMQQPEIWRRWFATFDVTQTRRWIDALEIDEIWLCGAGTSAYIGDILAAGLIDSTGPRIRSIATTDIVATPHLYLHNVNPLVINFGRSGDSAESIGTLDALDVLAPHAPRLNITCNGKSALATRQSQAPTHVIVLPSETHDLGFAMTSSFSTMLFTALALLDRSTNPIDAIDKIDETFHKLVPEFVELAQTRPERIVYLGTGPLAFAAREASLKTLELTAGQIASMWESTLGFRHGPKSFVRDDTMVVVFRSPNGHARSYEADLLTEMQEQFPNNQICSVDLAAQPCSRISENTAWFAPLMVALAQIQSATWSNELSLNVDNPFQGKGTLSRVVSGVTLHEVPKW